MNALLARLLAVVVAVGVQWYVGIRDIMSYFRRKFKYGATVFFTESFGKPLQHNVDPPGNDAMRHQAILTVFFHRHMP